MNQFFLASLTKAINAYINLDEESAARLQKLNGKLVAIELLPFHFNFLCEFNEHGIVITANQTSNPNTVIRGTPLQMLNVTFDKENRKKFFANDLVLEGDAELGQDVIALFDAIDINLEEHLSRYIGDVPAYHLGRLVDRVGSWVAHAKNSLLQNTSEYLHEEARVFPAAEELQDFFADIDTLQMDTDRLEARFNKLKEQIIQEEAAQ